MRWVSIRAWRIWVFCQLGTRSTMELTIRTQPYPQLQQQEMSHRWTIYSLYFTITETSDCKIQEQNQTVNCSSVVHFLLSHLTITKHISPDSKCMFYIKTSHDNHWQEERKFKQVGKKRQMRPYNMNGENIWWTNQERKRKEANCALWIVTVAAGINVCCGLNKRFAVTSVWWYWRRRFN